MASDLQLRLTLTHFAVTFAGMLVIGAAFTALLATRITASHERDLHREAAALSSQLDHALVGRTSPQILQKIIQHDAELLSKQIILLDRQGRLRYDSNHPTPFSRGAWRLSDMRTSQSGAFAGAGRLGFQLPLNVKGKTVGAVALVISPGDEGVDWGRTLPFVFLLFGVLAIVWLAVGAYFARSVSRPLRQVSNALQHARDGRYDHPVPEEGWSEARTLATRYNEMVAEVARAQRMQRDFMVNAAHELKTPIALVSGFASSLADGTAQRGGALGDAVGYIKEESEHLSRIVEGLFALASLDANPGGISPDPCHPDVLLRQVADRFRSRAAMEGKILSVDVAPDLPPCPWDAHWISSALTNLVSNALDHTLTGDTVTVRARIGASVSMHSHMEAGHQSPALPHTAGQAQQELAPAIGMHRRGRLPSCPPSAASRTGRAQQELAPTPRYEPVTSQSRHLVVGRAVGRLTPDGPPPFPHFAASSLARHPHSINPIVELSVEDTGCGIPSEDLLHIFERFYRGKREQRVDGHAGLGLALVREVAERHHGSVRATSVLAKGTCITLVLPAGAVVAEKVPA